MIEWQYPWFLLGLLLLPLLAAWRRRRRPRLRFSSLGLIRPISTPRRLLAGMPDLLLLLGLGLGLVALARPQLTQRETVVHSEGIDIMLLLDTSGSMQTPDFSLGGRRATRLDAAKNVISRFVDGRGHDRIGLVVFGEEAFTQVPLTLDHDALQGFLKEVQIGMAGEKRTAIGDALAVAGKRIKDIDAPTKVIILLTDGNNNTGSIGPDEAARLLAALDIKVYAIGVGGSGGNGLGAMLMGARDSGLDEATLRQVSETTHGKYFRADTAEALQQVYATIDMLEKSTADVREYVHREERYGPWLEASLIALGLQVLLSATFLRRLP